ncbi:methyltransferase domain-containing protein [Micromonospora sp. NPDC048170]|uniref:protein-L-isoaspartate O-methyltransferase family protein n=1 Tax=Micromonospora sp. NPDC048170 TaxID=3154819 RepID=UPI0034106C70
MTATDPLLASVPEQFYVHNPDRGETLHRSATEAIQRDVTALHVCEGDHVLEIGTGTGYSGALLAARAGATGRVTSIDISGHLVDWADRLHRQRGVTTITCHTADGMNGYPPHAPYQRIAAWCTPPRLPRAWVDQLAPDGRIVACLPIVTQPSTTLVTTITLTAGQPHVEAVTFGGYAQSTATAVDDTLTLPGRWVDHHTGHPDPAWISIGWRDQDDSQHTGACTALNLLRNPGHTETYHRAPLDWPSWTAYSVVGGGPQHRRPGRRQARNRAHHRDHRSRHPGRRHHPRRQHTLTIPDRAAVVAAPMGASRPTRRRLVPSPSRAERRGGPAGLGSTSYRRRQPVTLAITASGGTRPR